MSTVKKQYALQKNIESFVSRHGVDSVLFITMTFPDNVTEAKVAQSRWNSFATNFFRRRFPAGYILVKERQKRGSWHYHIITAVPENIRVQGWWSGKRFHTRNKTLLLLWSELRQERKKYGFGREETRPIRKDGPSVANYLSKYLSKHFRLRSDKGVRLVQYASISRVASEHFGWVSSFARSCRKKIAHIALNCFDSMPSPGEIRAFVRFHAVLPRIGAITENDLYNSLGRHWGFKLWRVVSHLVEHQRSVAFNLAVDEKPQLCF